jgi:hypothetical protein
MEGVHAKTHQDCNRHNNDGLVRSDVLANVFGRDGEGCCRGCRSIETRVRHRLPSTPTNSETCTAVVRIRFQVAGALAQHYSVTVIYDLRHFAIKTKRHWAWLVESLPRAT